MGSIGPVFDGTTIEVSVTGMPAPPDWAVLVGGVSIAGLLLGAWLVSYVIGKEAQRMPI